MHQERDMHKPRFWQEKALTLTFLCFSGRWRMSENLDVNYIANFQKSGVVADAMPEARR